jgi:CheY-like chemotaxis protein
MRQHPLLSSILLVDDDDTTNFINEQLLLTLGVVGQVLVARNGEEALTVLAETCGQSGNTCPALILLDINMPVMNGIEFLEAYQPQLPAKPIVVIALTTTSHPSDTARLRELSIANIITKPLNRSKVDFILQQYF